ncbi:hypothetical protein HMPREF9129_1899 [Peptoniphilus indolicus ATCC 29427]|uniref:Uncharacterized protein n=1 Tax=Peptoniphilus indolicus ATCC 29427 TaxID=997350 RepID=G4D669_9FIRM|nr:hypothetical protein HMPREF9129_1899 [Peptoniphilus indolicus ATCC 29427]
MDIRCLIPCEYLEYADSSVQLFFQEFTYIGYFFATFILKIFLMC